MQNNTTIGETKERDSHILLVGTKIYTNLMEENLANSPPKNTYVFTY